MPQKEERKRNRLDVLNLLSSNVLLLLLTVCCLYIVLFIFVGPSCLASLIVVTAFIVTFSLITYLCWKTLFSNVPDRQKDAEKGGKQPINKPSNDYNSVGTEEAASEK